MQTTSKNEILAGLSALGVVLGQMLPQFMDDEDTIHIFANYIVELRKEMSTTSERQEYIEVLNGLLEGIDYNPDHRFLDD